jgi:hypothetical protein
MWERPVTVRGVLEAWPPDDRERVLALRPCSEARRWIRSQSGTAYALWRRCDRGDWLLWLAARAGVDRRLVVLAVCDCAETALVHASPGEDRPRFAIETARRWARGDATIGEVRAAAYDAAAADAAAAYYAAAYAAYAAYYAAAYAARSASLTESARIVRRRIPWSVVRDAWRARGER